MLLRGIWYRRGRSATVLLLAAVAVAAAVLAPGYSRAAQQSVLTDGLAAAPPGATGLTLAATGTAAGAPAAHQPLAETRLVVETELARLPDLAALLADPVAGADTDTMLTGPSGEPLTARLAWRDRICDQLVITGQCPVASGEVLVSDRSAAAYGLGIGDRLAATPVGADAAPVWPDLLVVGTYQPRERANPYWGRTVYFTHGGFDPVTGTPRLDAIFTGDPQDIPADPAAVVSASLTYPLRTEAVTLDHTAGLRRALTEFHNSARLSDLELTTELPAVLTDLAADAAAIRQTAPLLALPLLLLAWFVLYLLVAAVTEERGREVALARLRGFGGGRAARFGLGEVLVLLAAAAPLGFGLGLVAVALAARLALAAGTPVELRWPLFAAAAAALAAAALAALLAARTTLRLDALELLRRVPRRSRWRAGLWEGLLLALAAACLVVALSDPSAPLALLAPALLALVAGVLAARLAVTLARLRLRRRQRGGRRVARMLAAAQLARRPLGGRVIAVSTVAVSLLSFAAIAWDVAAQARRDRATDLLGADRVYTVQATHPAALAAAVAAADPGGNAMAVVRGGGQYAGQRVELLAVDTRALPQVVRWRGHDIEDLSRQAEALRPYEPEPLLLRQRLEVRARVSDLGDAPVRLTALVVAPGQPPRAVPLGTLAAGTRDYQARLPACPAGCRLLGLGLGRTGVAGPFTATVEVLALRSDGADLLARFDDPAAWQADNGIGLASGASLRVAVGAGHTGDVLVEYRDTPSAVPAVLAGPAPAEDPAAELFRFPALAERPEPFQAVGSVPRLPRAGERGLLFDLSYAIASAERSVALADQAGLRYEVWASTRAPEQLPQSLAEQGVVVLASESIDAAAERLANRAPALGLWLGLLAAAAATLLAVGVVALSGSVQAPARRGDLAALRAAGVPEPLLRRALRREYAALLGWPLLVGTVAGAAIAGLTVPVIPLVETGVASGLPDRWSPIGGLVALAATGVGLLLAVAVAIRSTVGGRR